MEPQNTNGKSVNRERTAVQGITDIKKMLLPIEPLSCTNKNAKDPSRMLFLKNIQTSKKGSNS